LFFLYDTLGNDNVNGVHNSGSVLFQTPSTETRQHEMFTFSSLQVMTNDHGSTAQPESSESCISSSIHLIV